MATRVAFEGRLPAENTHLEIDLPSSHPTVCADEAVPGVEVDDRSAVRHPRVQQGLEDRARLPEPIPLPAPLKGHQTGHASNSLYPCEFSEETDS